MFSSVPLDGAGLSTETARLHIMVHLYFRLLWLLQLTSIGYSQDGPEVETTKTESNQGDDEHSEAEGDAAAAVVSVLRSHLCLYVCA